MNMTAISHVVQPLKSVVNNMVFFEIIGIAVVVGFVYKKFLSD